MSSCHNPGTAESRTPTSHCLPTTGSRTIRFGRGSTQGIGEGGVVGLARSRHWPTAPLPHFCRQHLTEVRLRPVGQCCTSLGALHQLGSITPAPNWYNTPLSGVTPLRNKPHRGAVTRHSIEEPLGPSARPHIKRRRCDSTGPRATLGRGTIWIGCNHTDRLSACG